MLKKMIKSIIQFFNKSPHEDYLNNANNIVDLEMRMRKIQQQNNGYNY